MPADILVKTANPKALDETVQQLAAAVVIEQSPGVYLQIEPDTYVVRVLSGAHGYVRFAITNQGYGEVIQWSEEMIV